MSIMNLEDFIDRWDLETMPACDKGMELLRQFAENHPDTFGQLQPEDFIKLDNPAFLLGIAEWEAFAEHCSTCEECNET